MQLDAQPYMCSPTSALHSACPVSTGCKEICCLPGQALNNSTMPGWLPSIHTVDAAPGHVPALCVSVHAPVRRPRYCKHCQCWKPERSHHCRVNGRCVLRMDHYCIWLVNCVGLLNYKAFLLFLFYAMLGCLLATLLLIQPTVDMFSNKMNSFRCGWVSCIGTCTCTCTCVLMHTHESGPCDRLSAACLAPHA